MHRVREDLHDVPVRGRQHLRVQLRRPGRHQPHPHRRPRLGHRLHRTALTDFGTGHRLIKLVSNITYIHSWAGFLYLATAIDCHAKAVISWVVAEHMKASLISDALDIAARNANLAHGAYSTRIAASRADSTGRHNTSITEVLMGRPAGWMKELTGRSPMKSLGKPSLRRDVERLFWREIDKGLTSEEAAIAVGASQAAGSRWFRERGGMPTFLRVPVTGRYLWLKSGKRSPC